LEKKTEFLEVAENEIVVYNNLLFFSDESIKTQSLVLLRLQTVQQKNHKHAGGHARCDQLWSESPTFVNHN